LDKRAQNDVAIKPVTASTMPSNEAGVDKLAKLRGSSERSQVEGGETDRLAEASAVSAKDPHHELVHKAGGSSRAEDAPEPWPSTGRQDSPTQKPRAASAKARETSKPGKMASNDWASSRPSTSPRNVRSRGKTSPSFAEMMGHPKDALKPRNTGMTIKRVESPEMETEAGSTASGTRTDGPRTQSPSNVIMFRSTKA